MHTYSQMNEKRISQIKKLLTDKKQQLWILWLQKGQMQELNVFMYEYACIFESTAPWSIQKAKSHNGSS